MKFEKVTELCKKSRKFLIFKYSEKIYFLGTGNAMFVVPDGTICTPEYLTSFAGLKPLEVENTIFDKKDFPFEFDISDIADNESYVSLPEIRVSDFDGKNECVPIFTAKGAVFVPSIYFEPFKNDEYELYERKTSEDVSYLVIKVGMFVKAVIVLDYSNLALQTVTYFKTVAKAPCGDDGAGRFYKAVKAKRPNKCKHFEFLNADIFRQDENGNFAEYKPRTVIKSDYEQIKI